MTTSLSYSSLKASRSGLGNIYEDQLLYEAETGDRPWLEGFYRRLETWSAARHTQGVISLVSP